MITKHIFQSVLGDALKPGDVVIDFGSGDRLVVDVFCTTNINGEKIVKPHYCLQYDDADYGWVDYSKFQDSAEKTEEFIQRIFNLPELELIDEVIVLRGSVR